MGTMGGAQYWLTRFYFQRGLGFIYLIAFLIVVNQFRPLVGDKGLLPASLFLKEVEFWDAPSIFWLHCSNKAFMAVGCVGVLLSLTAVTGLCDSYGIMISTLVWSLLWVFYLSFVNIGQTFYGFGWETLLLETGFLGIFLGSKDTPTPAIVIWLIRWVLFRVMFGAGMIKLRGDPCWRDLTCMFYHYETQPLPNPLSWYFHRLPPFMHKFSVLFTHFVELIVPWVAFAPRPLCYIAGLLMAFFQFTLILSGNLSWLNFITILLCVACFDDAFLSRLMTLDHPTLTHLSGSRQAVMITLAVIVFILSIRPARNLISRRQMMNASFEPLHLVNTYGAFGSITQKRMEVILEGTDDTIITPATKWQEYEFKGKPGDVHRMPVIVSPYHYKLDWQMWFAAMSPYYYHPWILNLVAKLLKNDQDTLSLMAKNPFPKNSPKFIRASLYEYHFSDFRDKLGDWWTRKWEQEYLPPLSLNSPGFRQVLEKQGWL